MELPIEIQKISLAQNWSQQIPLWLCMCLFFYCYYIWISILNEVDVKASPIKNAAMVWINQVRVGKQDHGFAGKEQEKWENSCICRADSFFITNFIKFLHNMTIKNAAMVKINQVKLWFVRGKQNHGFGVNKILEMKVHLFMVVKIGEFCIWSCCGRPLQTEVLGAEVKTELQVHRVQAGWLDAASGGGEGWGPGRDSPRLQQ